MQGVILAIAKARQTFDRDGSEAGLIKVSPFFNFSSLYHRYHKHGAKILLDGTKRGLKMSFIEVKPKTRLPAQLMRPSPGLVPTPSTSAPWVSSNMPCHAHPEDMLVFRKCPLVRRPLPL